MSDLISREAVPLPCPLCSAEIGIEGEGWEHPASDDCPLDSLFILPHHVTAWNRRALPPAQEAAPAVKVKPLVWRMDPDRDDDYPRWLAETGLGKTYHVFKAWWGAQEKWGFVGLDGYHHSEAAAKAAAQADYEARILAALEGGEA